MTTRLKERALIQFRNDGPPDKFLWQVLPDGSWANNPCFVVGGGPSLNDGFDWGLLDDKLTIATNRAYEKIKNPTITFSMDRRFLNWLLKGKYGPEATFKYNSMKSYRVLLSTKEGLLPLGIYRLNPYKSYNLALNAFTFSMKDGLGHGNNTGYAALNLACCLEANPIYLLGFDMKHGKDKDGREKSHWHDGHPVPQKEWRIRRFVPRFETAAPLIAAYGFKVYNLVTEPTATDLKCFPIKRIKEVLG